MRTLLVATNTTPAGILEDIHANRCPRVDYLELCRHLPASYTDYRAVPSSNWAAGLLESRLRLDFRLALRVAHLVRSRGHDVVFSLSERVGIPLAALLPRRIRHVVWLHHPLSAAKLLLLRMSALAPRWSLALTLSKAERDSLRHSLGLAPERVGCLSYHVDTRFFSPRLVDSSAANGYLLSLGASYRDYATLADALRALPEIPGRIHVGSSWVTGNLGLDRGTLPPNLQVASYLQPNVLRDVYAASRFVVVPLRPTTQWSAGCTTVLQAQAMGRAVIATRIPGIQEYVLDGETGLLVEPSDPGAMADAIAWLWKDPARASAMGRRARDWVESSFSLDCWLGTVTDLLGGRTSPQPEECFGSQHVAEVGPLATAAKALHPVPTEML